MERKQEILLFTTSRLAKEDSYKKQESRKYAGSVLSPVEKLEEECVNGLLNEFLNTANVNHKDNGKLFLWKIHVADSFLCVQLSQSPIVIEHFYSLDPYSFLSELIYN